MIIVGGFMLAYVIFGGMLATTWVQIIKATLLMTAGVVLAVFVGAKVGFSPTELFSRAAENHPKGLDYLKPGLQFDSGLALLSFGIAFVFGTAGLPHILMRFFTVPNAKAARGSVGWAVFLIGAFYLIVMFVGVGARAILDADRGQGGGRDRQPRDPGARRAPRRRQGLDRRRHLPGHHLGGRAGDDPRGRRRARDLGVGRGRARRVVQRHPQGPRLREGGGRGSRRSPRSGSASSRSRWRWSAARSSTSPCSSASRSASPRA